MKLEGLKEKIGEAIYRAEKITGKNPTLPILSSLLLETKNNLLIIKSTNLDLGIEIEVPVKVLKPGKCAVPASILSSFLASSDDKNVTFELSQNLLNVFIGKANAKINTTPFDDFPIIPKLSKEMTFTIESEAFVKGLRSVWYSASPSSMKPELSSVFIYYDNSNNSLVFVATDSFRLAEKRIKLKKLKDFESVLIPFKNIPEIIRILESNNGDILVAVENGQVAFFLDSIYLVSRIIDGTFPDYQQIIPKESKTEVVVLKQDILNTLKTTHVFSDSLNQVNLSISPGKKMFEVKTSNTNVGESESNLEAVLKGEDLNINFNYKYVFDCFQSIDSDSVTLVFSGLSKPLVIQGVSNKSFLYLVMPMNK